MPKNALYAQSGGVTSVINATAHGLISSFSGVAKVYAAKNGILGALTEELFDTDTLTQEQLASLSHRAGGAFGSCRYKMPDPEKNSAPYDRLLAVCQAHDIGYFFYNGGNDSHDTADKINRFAQSIGSGLRCIGLPKTIDNDLECTDFCPGFPSTARYTILSTLEIALDLQAMAQSSTKLFVLEVMGRHAGWIAASAALAKDIGGISAPHIILTPEHPYTLEQVNQAAKKAVDTYGHCLIVVAEGIEFEQLNTGQAQSTDAFGHQQLGGIGLKLAQAITASQGFKHHVAIPDYLQRSARHAASGIDVELAWKTGYQAGQWAQEGQQGFSAIIKRQTTDQGEVSFAIGQADLSSMANAEKSLPAHFIDAENLGITEEFCQWLRPLITEPSPSPTRQGLPFLPALNLQCIEQKLKAYSVDA